LFQSRGKDWKENYDKASQLLIEVTNNVSRNTDLRDAIVAKRVLDAYKSNKLEQLKSATENDSSRVRTWIGANGDKNSFETTVGSEKVVVSGFVGWAITRLMAEVKNDNDDMAPKAPLSNASTTALQNKSILGAGVTKYKDYIKVFGVRKDFDTDKTYSKLTWEDVNLGPSDQVPSADGGTALKLGSPSWLFRAATKLKADGSPESANLDNYANIAVFQVDAVRCDLNKKSAAVLEQEIKADLLKFYNDPNRTKCPIYILREGWIGGQCSTDVIFITKEKIKEFIEAK
jgi:hypothetical protein